jgi:V/A-type H+-transporting ATPase subunit F
MDYYFIGDPELVTAFRFIGIEGTAVKDQGEALSVFRKITEGWDETAASVLPMSDMSGCRVLVMTEETADWLGDNLVNWQLSDRYPLVVEIPGIMGRLAGRKTLVDSIREAIGVHV